MLRQLHHFTETIMAEILGITASVVQFIDTGAKLSIKLSSFCSDVHDAPETVCSLLLDLNHQLDIARGIQDRTSQMTLSVSTAQNVPSLLQTHINLAQELLALLLSLELGPCDSMIRRSWKAIRAVKKKERILDICERLERQKTGLALWFSHVNRWVHSEMLAFPILKYWRLISIQRQSLDETSATVGLVQDSLQKNLVLTERIDESSRSNSLILEKAVALIEGSAENVARISMATHSLLPLVNDIQLLSTTTTVHSEQTIQSLERFAESNMILADVINRLALSQQTPESNGRNENLRSNFRSNIRTIHLRDISTELQNQPRQALPCSCRSFSH
jgi:hypothetical protein